MNAKPSANPDSIREVFWRFLLLGLMSFGGPAAHIGYFRKAFVERLQWLDDAAYARLVALSQFLPGPASSQVGFAIGLRRAGPWGGLAAFLGFTLPSFALMYLLAVAGPTGHAAMDAVIHSLKLLAVVVVADATLGMFRTFCTQRLTVAIAVLSAAALLSFPGLWQQLLVLLAAAAIGAAGLSGEPTTKPVKARVASRPLALFALLFAGLIALGALHPLIALLADFYQTGSLVFGGGHVVLPLLQQSVGEQLSTDRFLLGYAAAQAVPGPMFSLAAFLGADLAPNAPLLGALLATIGIFLPGFLLVMALQGAWESLTARPAVAGAAAGINAAVVGLLLAALYQPVFTSAVQAPSDFALVLLGFFALRGLKLPVPWLVAAFALAGWIVSQ